MVIFMGYVILPEGKSLSKVVNFHLFEGEWKVSLIWIKDFHVFLQSQHRSSSKINPTTQI